MIHGVPPSMPPREELLRQRKLLDARALADREPHPPPFAPGQRVQYIGPALPPCRIGDIRFPGMAHDEVFVIGHAMKGHVGSLEQQRDLDNRICWWDDAHTFPMLDTTVDGMCSILRKGIAVRGYLIDHAVLADWKLHEQQK